MKNRGFTLIEVIVTMTIISILVGIIVPISYRVWETNEIGLTRDKMASIKKAMIGDPNLYQQGIRVDYGFVGDHGELPATLEDLITDQGTYPSWDGPYLGSNLDPRYFAEDSWGEALRYTTASDALGRRVTANLTSTGPDRLLGTSDDLDTTSAPTEQITLADVTPTNTVEGNLTYVVSVSDADESPVYYATLSARYQDIGGEALTNMLNCVRLDIGLVQKLVPRSGAVRFQGSFPLKFPIGKVVVASRLFANDTCSGVPLTETAGSLFFVTPGLNTIPINPPVLYYRINNGP